MDSGEAIFFHHPLRQQNRVLEVVAIPGHEGDAHVLAQCQITHVDGRAIGKDIATLDHVTGADNGTLVHAGVLVGAHVFGQVVNINPGLTADDLILLDPHHDTLGIDRVDHPAATRHRTDTRVTGNETLHAGTHQRLFGS